MSGKDFLIRLGDISLKYYDEAENDSMSISRKQKVFRGPILAAVIIVLTLLLAVGAVACAYGWLTDFFTTQSDVPLSSDQVAYIEEKEQVIGQSQTNDGWAVQLKSAINDGRTAYIILGITAPKNIDLESPGTSDYYLSDEFAELISNNKQIEIQSEESGWELDDDGLPNTLDYVIRFEPVEEDDTPEPYSTEVEWKIHIENILCQNDNADYFQELLNGKYKGQDDFMLTEEEIDRLHQQEVIAEGVWDFTFTFEQSSTGIDLVSAPITVKAYASRNEKEGKPSYEDVTITAFSLNAFSVEIRHEADALVTFTNPENEKVAVVMGDGSEIQLRHDSTTRDTTVLNSSVPIVLSEVDHIRMPDGTILRMAE